MKIFICGSMYFAKKMIYAHKKLKKMGHEPELPCDTQEFLDNPNFTTDNHEENYKHCVDNDIIRRSFNSIAANEAILCLNYAKNLIDGYLGTSALMEIGLAYFLKKKIFLLYPPPPVKKFKSTHEILIMQPIILHGDLSLIK